MYKGVITLPRLPHLMGLEPNLRTLIQVFFRGAQVNISLDRPHRMGSQRKAWVT